MNQRDNAATAAELTSTLSAPLAELGLDVEAVEVSQAGKRRLLRVALDKDGGVTLDDVADATKLISGVLDSDEVMGDAPYTLEVTSRGVDRPLTLPRHWRRNAGRLVKVTLTAGDQIAGRIDSSDDSVATVLVDGARVEVAFDDVLKALVQIEFNRPATDPETDDPTEQEH